MKCANCETSLKEGVKFCGTCGEKVSTPNKKVFFCSHCDETVEKERWGFRDAYGVFLLICGSIIPGIIYFIDSSPYVCPKCQKREFLSYKKDNQEIKINCLSKKKFKNRSAFWGVILVLIIFLKVIISFGNGYSEENLKTTVIDLNKELTTNQNYNDDPHLISYDSVGKKLIYNFQIQKDVSEYTFDSDLMTTNLCSNSDTKDGLDHGVIYSFVYKDPKGNIKKVISIDSSMCK